jgi:hypothetical protein
LKSKKAPGRTVTGILIPQQWDDDGNVVGMSIQAFDETEYIVKTTDRVKEFLDFINQKVKVTGKVSERLDGKLLVEVNRFEVIES